MERGLSLASGLSPLYFQKTRNATGSRTAISILALKADRTWDELFVGLTNPARITPLVFSDDPGSIIPMIRQGLEFEAQGLQESVGNDSDQG